MPVLLHIRDRLGVSLCHTTPQREVRTSPINSLCLVWASWLAGSGSRGQRCSGVASVYGDLM